MGATLKDTFEEAFRAGKEGVVKTALSRRLKVKRSIRDGKRVSRVDRANSRITPNETAVGALADDAEKSGVSRDAEIAKDKAKSKPKKKKEKKDVFGVGTAIRNIQKNKGA